jgi:hypothetical protein
VFEGVLIPADARRAARGVETVIEHGLRPAVAGSLARALQLRALGRALPVTWVQIGDPNPAGSSSTAVFNQGRALGAASFARLEGCWWGSGAVSGAEGIA